MTDKPETGDVEVYAVGLCKASVCVPEKMTLADIVNAVNLSHPTGISSRWEISTEPNFKTGEPNPCRCEAYADRLHYLLEC